jgi:hypothetical protein
MRASVVMKKAVDKEKRLSFAALVLGHRGLAISTIPASRGKQLDFIVTGPPKLGGG